jgi:hypothetical protein
MDNIPSDEKEYVRTNGDRGYGCACLGNRYQSDEDYHDSTR